MCPALMEALGKIAPTAAVRAALLVRSVPSAAIACGEFCCAIATASSSEIFRALSGALVRPGWRPGLMTCAATELAELTIRNAETASSLFKDGKLGIDRVPNRLKAKGRT